MDAVVKIDEVMTFETRTGTTRYVLVGESEPHEEVPPGELYDKLKPFKERVAEDIKEERET